MPRTGLVMNWTGVTITGTSPVVTAIAIANVLDIKINGKSAQELFYGDNNAFAVFIRNTAKTRSITIVGGDVQRLLSVGDDTENTIVAIFNDAGNNTGAGALTMTLVRAKKGSFDTSGANNKYGAAELTFQARGAASDADPLSIVEAS